MPLSSKPRRPDYLNEDTIASIASATGGPIAILRLSGPDTKRILKRLNENTHDLKPNEIRRFEIRNSDSKVLDDAMIAFFKAPHSYTGEDGAEIYVHGASIVASHVLSALIEYGARQSLSGEFSFRAVRNGKMDVNQAKAVSDLIGAKNQSAVEVALEKLSGTQTDLFHSFHDSIRMLVAESELGIDFSDQDVEELGIDHLKEKLKRVIEQLKVLQNSFSRGKKIQNGIDVALLGLPNAGKSSLFNSILSDERSIVTEIAGTTRDVVKESILLENDQGSFHFNFLDTAGLRKTSDRVESIGVEKSIEAAQRSDLVVFVKDPLVSSQENNDALKSLDIPPSKLIEVYSKSDLKVSQDNLAISSVTQSGIQSLIDQMIDWGKSQTSRYEGEVIITQIDQLEAIGKTIECFKRALIADTHDLFASDLRVGLSELTPLIGETLADDILGDIFSKFCIGK